MDSSYWKVISDKWKVSLSSPKSKKVLKPTMEEGENKKIKPPKIPNKQFQPFRKR